MLELIIASRPSFYAQFCLWYTFLYATRRPRVLAVEYTCNHVTRGVELRVSSAANRRSSRCRSSFSEDRFRGRAGLETRRIVHVPQFVCTRPEPNGRASAPFENRRTMNSADVSGFSAKSPPKLRSRAERTHIDYNARCLKGCMVLSWTRIGQYRKV